MPQTIEVESIKRLDVKPGDILAVRIPATNQATIEQVADSFRSRLPDSVQVLVIGPDVELSVLSAAACQSSPA